MSIQTIFKRHEFKKKYRRVVYKRRIVMPEQEAMGQRSNVFICYRIGIGRSNRELTLPNMRNLYGR